MALQWQYRGVVKISDNEHMVVDITGGAHMNLTEREYNIDISDVLVNNSSVPSVPSGPTSGATNPGNTSPGTSSSINEDGSAYLIIPMSAVVYYEQFGTTESPTLTYLAYNNINISYNHFSCINDVTVNAYNINVSINNIYSNELYEHNSYYLPVTGGFYDQEYTYEKTINVNDSRIYFTNPPQLNLSCSSAFVTGDTNVEYGCDLIIKFSINGISLTRLQKFCDVSVTSDNNYVTVKRQSLNTNGNNSVVVIKITGNNASVTNRESKISLSIRSNSQYIKLNNGSNLTNSVTVTSINTIFYNTLIDVNKTSITLNKIQNIDSRYALIDLLGNSGDIIVYCYTGSSLSKPYKENCSDYYSFGDSWLNCTVTSNNTNIVSIESIEVKNGLYDYYLIAKSPGTTSIILQTLYAEHDNLIYYSASKTITVTVTEESLNPVSSGKIATINDINTKFNITLSTDEQYLNLCVSYSMIKDIAVIAPLTSNTRYSNNQLVILDAIVNIPPSNDGFEIVLPNITVPTAAPTPTPSASPTPTPPPAQQLIEAGVDGNTTFNIVYNESTQTQVMTISPIQGTDGKLPDSYDRDIIGCPLSPLYVYQYGIRDENWEYIVEPKWDGTPIDIIVEEGITEIPSETFMDCDINSLTLPESLISGTFERVFCCDILEIPANTIYIGGFSESDFKHIIIGENVQELGNYVFDHCLNLETVTFLSKTPPSVDSFFACVLPNFEIYVPGESIELYKNHPDWQDVVNMIKPIPQTSSPTVAPTQGPTGAPTAGPTAAPKL